VISPDVGGGFGSKISPYPEDYLVPALSRLAERPVKWIETRTESLQNATHGRGQYYDVEVAAKKDGTLLAMRMTQFLDVGAYVGTFGAFQPVACLMAGGGYKWKGISARTVGVLTNRVPTDPYRGAGRPEATHLVERMVDLVALELKMDPVDIRRKNFIQPEDFPFTQNFGLVVDSGDYDKSLDKALELAGYAELRKKQADLRKQGRYMGIGLSTWIELCGFGPSAAACGVAISKAVDKVIDKGKKLAAHIFEAAEEDVVFEHGNFHVKGSPDKSKAFGEVAFASYGMGLPEGMEQGLEAVAYFDP